MASATLFRSRAQRGMGPCVPPSLMLRRPYTRTPAKPWRRRVAGTTKAGSSRSLITMRPAHPHAEFVALARGIAMQHLESGIDQLRLHLHIRHVRQAVDGVGRASG